MTRADPPDQATRVKSAAQRLRIDAATAEVIAAIEAAEIDCRLLKGPALAEWYRDAPDRAYLDCDLWLPPQELSRARGVLARLGFERSLDDDRLPDWWVEHATEWRRAADGVSVDLHGRLQGAEGGDEDVWAALSEPFETIEVAGYPARILATPARALYVTLHAAHHGEQWGKATIHLERALACLDLPVWEAASALAERVGAGASFEAGLRLVPPGAMVADTLGLHPHASIRVRLRASSPPPIALGLEQLATAGSNRMRLRILARKLVPPPAFIRHWWPPAARSRSMLALGYLYRPAWLLRNTPRGLRAWLGARRALRRDD